jgi:hypothetical protein
VLVIWRTFDKEGTSIHGAGATTSGIEWGIFVALGVAAFLAYAGSSIRIAHVPEPPLPGENDPPSPSPSPSPSPAARARRSGQGPVRPPRPVRADDPPTGRLRDPSPPAAQARSELHPDDQLTIPFEPNGSDG